MLLPTNMPTASNPRIFPPHKNTSKEMELIDTSIIRPIEILPSQPKKEADSPQPEEVSKSASKWLRKRDKWIFKRWSRLKMSTKRYWVLFRVQIIPKPMCMRLVTKLRNNIGKILPEIIQLSVIFNGTLTLLQDCTKVNTDLLLFFRRIINKTMSYAWDWAARQRRIMIWWCVLDSFKAKFLR